MAVFSYEQLRNMNPGEFRVYNFIVSHLDAVPDMNIRQIAAGAKVSTTTVLRFCEKSGCSGYTELKYRIRQELNGQVPAGRFDTAPAVQYMETSAKDSVFTDKMAQAAKLCADAGQIILSGDRESKPLIRYGAYLFSCAGKAAFPAEDGWGIVCPKGETRHALLILSPWGSGQDLIALVNTYKKAGAPPGYHNQHRTLPGRADVGRQFFLLYAGNFRNLQARAFGAGLTDSRGIPAGDPDNRNTEIPRTVRDCRKQTGIGYLSVFFM